jgi:hypothetical protein
MARGASGVWLRAGSRLGLVCRGTVIFGHRSRKSSQTDRRPISTARALAILTRAVGGFGCIARSVVLVLVGFFIIKPRLRRFWLEETHDLLVHNV